MKRVAKWTGIVLGGLVLLLILAGAGLYLYGNARLTRSYSVEPEPVSIPSDPSAIQKGKKIAETYCTHCHGAQLSGMPVLNNPQVGSVSAPNLTPGEGGAGSEFKDSDWVRALRYGIDPEGRALLAMPSQNYTYMSDGDLGNLIAYLKTLPPINNSVGDPALTPMGKALLAAGAFGDSILPAEVITRTVNRPKTIVAAADITYGEYLVRLEGCHDCHGKDYTGGHSPAPGSPYAPDLTSRGPVGQWSQEVFIAAVRTMNGKGMPWADLKPLSDAELSAVYQYIHALPGK